MTKDISSDALAQVNENNVGTGDGGNGTAFEVKGDSAPLHEVLNEVLNTTFKSPEDAVKGLKDTLNYVGKAGKGTKILETVAKAKGLSEDDAVKFIMDTVNQQAAPAATEVKPEQTQTPAPVDTSKFVSKEEFTKELFYKDNPQLNAFKDILDPLANSLGKSHAEVAQMDSFKSLVDAKIAQDESNKTKSVLTSGPRLGTVADKMTQAQDALKAGNQIAAEKAATEAVIEAFGLKK